MRKNLKYIVFLIIIVPSSFLALGCVGKPPENDVALIKELLVKFEEGLREKNVTVLGSVTSKEQKDLGSKLITDFSAWGDIRNLHIASKRFTIVRDSAKVELKLKLEVLKSEKEVEEVEKPVNLFLNKKKGKWGIETYKIIKDDLSRVKSRDE